MKDKISTLALILAIVALSFGIMHRGTQNDSSHETAMERVARTKTLHCGYILFPPYLQKDLQTGEMRGVGLDLTQAIADTLHDKIEWTEEVPVGGETAALAKSNIDAVCSITGAYDANNFDQLAFSSYLAIVRNHIYARADDHRFDGPIELSALDRADVTFAGIEGDPSLVFPPMLMPHVKTKALPQLSEPAQLFQEVEYKKADLTMLEALPGMQAMQSNPGKFKILNVKNTLPTYAVQMVFAKNELALRDTVNEAIRFMKLNGQLESILTKYDPSGQVLVRPAF